MKKECSSFLSEMKFTDSHMLYTKVELISKPQTRIIFFTLTFEFGLLNSAILMNNYI